MPTKSRQTTTKSLLFLDLFLYWKIWWLFIWFLSELQLSWNWLIPRHHSEINAITMNFWVLQVKILAMTLQKICIMLCANKESTHSLMMESWKEGKRSLQLLFRWLDNQGFRSLYLQKIMHFSISVLLNLSTFNTIQCKIKGRVVWPIFYEVDPLEVKHHKGSFRRAMAKHEHRFMGDPEKGSQMEVGSNWSD